jgi:hypothetical protein
MIKVEQKPKKTIQYFDGTAALDQNYTFTIVKSINGSQKYTVENIQPEPANVEVLEMIEKTVQNYALREGVGVTNINTEG